MFLLRVLLSTELVLGSGYVKATGYSRLFQVEYPDEPCPRQECPAGKRKKQCNVTLETLGGQPECNG